MTRQEAEKLLGGYATGTLTDQERAQLFAAALDHQELFDALADEEALRELLADPAARRRLLQELPEPRRRGVGLWEWLRRPVAVGLAASLAGAAIVGIGLWRYRGAEKPETVIVAERREQPAPPAVFQKTNPLTAPAPANGPVAAAQKTKPIAAPPAAPEVSVAAAADAAKENIAPAAPEPREAKTLADAVRSEEVQTAAPSPQRQAQPVRLAERAATGADAGGAVGGVVGGIVGGVPRASMAAAPPAAARAAKAAAAAGHTLRVGQDGVARLTVPSPSGGYIYVVKRTGTGAEVILPVRSVAGPTGTTSAEYEFAVRPGDVVDLYILPNAVPAAERLPAPLPAALTGRYERIYPAATPE